jgi:predicted nuclease with RNAse H fold
MKMDEFRHTELYDTACNIRRECRASASELRRRLKLTKKQAEVVAHDVPLPKSLDAFRRSELYADACNIRKKYRASASELRRRLKLTKKQAEVVAHDVPLLKSIDKFIRTELYKIACDFRRECGASARTLRKRLRLTTRQAEKVVEDVPLAKPMTIDEFRSTKTYEVACKLRKDGVTASELRRRLNLSAKQALAVAHDAPLLKPMEEFRRTELYETACKLRKHGATAGELVRKLKLSNGQAKAVANDVPLTKEQKRRVMFRLRPRKMVENVCEVCGRVFRVAVGSADVLTCGNKYCVSEMRRRSIEHMRQRQLKPPPIPTLIGGYKTREE